MNQTWSVVFENRGRLHRVYYGKLGAPMTFKKWLARFERRGEKIHSIECRTFARVSPRWITEYSIPLSEWIKNQEDQVAAL